MADRELEKQLLSQLRAELGEAEQEFDAVQDRVERLRLAVRGLEAVVGNAGGKTEPPADHDRARGTGTIRIPARPDGPRGEAAVRQVLEDNAGQGFTLRELFGELQVRGWISPESKNPEAATRAAANRLRQKDARFIFEDGRFVFNPDVWSPEGTQVRQGESS